MLSPQSPIHLERTPPVWSPTAAGFFRFDIIHIRKGSPHEGFVDVWQEAESQGFEAEEENDGDEEDGDAEESKAGLLIGSQHPFTEHRLHMGTYVGCQIANGNFCNAALRFSGS
jgi:hypothetical protein